MEEDKTDKNMNTGAKLIKIIYLYLVATISLLFVSIGMVTLLNCLMKYYIFPEAEKKSYYECMQSPPIYALEVEEEVEAEAAKLKDVASEDQQKKLNQLLADYENWKENQSGEKCIISARQNKITNAITMIIIALPIMLIHWSLIRREKKNGADSSDGKV